MKVQCTQCFRLVSTKNRFKIFEYLKKHPKSTVGKLVNLTGLRQPTVTFHVNQLEKQGLLKKTKAGRQVFCQACKKCVDCPLFS